jgi:hypothetical protein
MDWTIGVLGFDSRQGLGIFLFTTVSRTAPGPTQPPIQWVQGAVSLGVKRRGVKLTTHLHLVPRSNNAWSYISTLSQYASIVWCLVKHRDNFTFTFTCFGHLVGLLGRGIGPSQGHYLHRTAQHRKMRTHIHASSGIRTRYPSVRAVEDRTCLDCAATGTGTRWRQKSVSIYQSGQSSEKKSPQNQ